MKTTEADTRLERAHLRGQLREQYAGWKPKAPMPGTQGHAERGWLLPILSGFDTLLWGRWHYWEKTMMTGALLDEPIPQIEWVEDARTPARKMWEAALDCVPSHGQRKSMASWEHVNYALDWVLYGFAHESQPEAPPEPHGCEGASDRLWQVFCLEAAQLWPHDYLGDLLAESKHGRGSGFFPTPMSLVGYMTQLTFEARGDVDRRREKTRDPCLGTGRFLLEASNYSLRLYGIDIDRTVLKAAVVNGYLYAPWLVRPFPFLRELADDESAEAEPGVQMVGKQAVLSL